MRTLLRLAALAPAVLVSAAMAVMPASAQDHSFAKAPIDQPWPGGIDRSWPEPSSYGVGNRSLVLTLNEGGRYAQDDRHALLVCSPVQTSGHPYAMSACAELDEADGNFTALRAQTPWYACSRRFDPVTVTARGVWDGRNVQYRRTFTNACQLRYATGSIFQF